MTERTKSSTHAEVEALRAEVVTLNMQIAELKKKIADREIKRLRKAHQDAYQRGLQAGSRGLREMYDAIQEIKRQDAWDNARLTETLMEAEERAERAEAKNQWLREALDGAARSLETISKLAGRDEYMQEMDEVRSYARNRAEVAFAALSASHKQGA